MTVDRLLVMGAGGHARACLDVIESAGGFTAVALIGTEAERGRQVLGYKVIGSDDDLNSLRIDFTAAFVGIGQITNPEPRIRLFNRLTEINFRLATIISPRAYVSRHAQLGAGTIVMHGAIVNAGAVIGDNCIINSGALIEHDAIVEDHCHVSTRAVINGGARIGRATFVGSGCAVRELVSIGENSLIGMGQRVLRDCAPFTRLTQQEVQ